MFSKVNFLGPLAPFTHCYFCKEQPARVSPSTNSHIAHIHRGTKVAFPLQKSPSGHSNPLAFSLQLKIKKKKCSCFIFNCLTFQTLTFLSVDRVFLPVSSPGLGLAGSALLFVSSTLPTRTRDPSPQTISTYPGFPPGHPVCCFSQGDEETLVGLCSVTGHSYSPIVGVVVYTGPAPPSPPSLHLRLRLALGPSCDSQTPPRHCPGLP